MRGGTRLALRKVFVVRGTGSEGLLDIGFGDGEVDDEGEDQYAEDGYNGGIAEAEAAVVGGFGQPVGDRGAEGRVMT